MAPLFPARERYPSPGGGESGPTFARARASRGMRCSTPHDSPRLRARWQSWSRGAWTICRSGREADDHARAVRERQSTRCRRIEREPGREDLGAVERSHVRERVGSSSTGPGPPGTHRLPSTACARPRPPGRNRPRAPIPGPIPPRPRPLTIRKHKPHVALANRPSSCHRGGTEPVAAPNLNLTLVPQIKTGKHKLTILTSEHRLLRQSCCVACYSRPYHRSMIRADNDATKLLTTAKICHHSTRCFDDRPVQYNVGLHVSAPYSETIRDTNDFHTSIAAPVPSDTRVAGAVRNVLATCNTPCRMLKYSAVLYTAPTPPDYDCSTYYRLAFRADMHRHSLRKHATPQNNLATTVHTRHNNPLCWTATLRVRREHHADRQPQLYHSPVVDSAKHLRYVSPFVRTEQPSASDGLTRSINDNSHVTVHGRG
jgi:hypothetical protein